MQPEPSLKQQKQLEEEVGSLCRTMWPRRCHEAPVPYTSVSGNRSLTLFLYITPESPNATRTRLFAGGSTPHRKRGRVTPRSGRRCMSSRCLTECCVPLRLWKSKSLIPLDEFHTAMRMDLQHDASGEPLQMFETLPLWRVYQSVMTRGRHLSCPGPAESFSTARCIGGSRDK